MKGLKENGAYLQCKSQTVPFRASSQQLRVYWKSETFQVKGTTTQ